MKRELSSSAGCIRPLLRRLESKNITKIIAALQDKRIKIKITTLRCERSYFLILKKNETILGAMGSELSKSYLAVKIVECEELRKLPHNIRS
ncbi:MAG: hypothetical protein PHQ17_03175 [Methanobacterium sp.]|nr:hypothetical protein [Methanobacterium sp.]